MNRNETPKQMRLFVVMEVRNSGLLVIKSMLHRIGGDCKRVGCFVEDLVEKVME